LYPIAVPPLIPLPTFSAQPATLLTKEDTPFLLANSLIFEGTYASVNSASFTLVYKS